jgi:hypothetical protein
MWTQIIINFFLVFSVYLFTMILAFAILSLWTKSREGMPKKRVKNKTAPDFPDLQQWPPG